MTKLSLNLYKLLFLFNAINCLLIVCRSEEVQVSQNELASDDGEESKVFAVNARLATGDLAQFPIFDQRYQKIDPEFKKMTLRHMDEYLGLIFGIVDKELDQPNSTNFMSWLMLSKQMVTVAVKQNKELKKLTSDYPAEKEFNLELSNLFKVGLQHSKAMAGKDVVPRISRQELKVKLHKFVETFMEIISISPTGLFMNFREGKLNDVPFPDILDETFTNLRENGFESLLGGLDKLLGFISMFS